MFSIVLEKVIGWLDVWLGNLGYRVISQYWLWYLSLALVLCAAFILYSLVALIFKKPLECYKDEHVVITGGSTGLGLYTAIEYFKKGAHVTILARNKKKLEQALLAIEDHRCEPNQKLNALSCDVSKFKSVQTQIDVCESWKPIHTLVTCAGISFPRLLSETTLDDFKKQIEVNYMGVVHATKAVVPYFAEREKGRLVFATSGLAISSCPGYSAYCGSKWAIVGFVNCLRSEMLLYDDVKVSIAYPPTMDTPGLKTENESKPELTWEIEQIANDIEDPADVAKDMVFKVSRLSTFSSGVKAMKKFHDLGEKIFHSKNYKDHKS